MDNTRESSKIARILAKANIARAVSDHLLGECHPIKHRMWVGGVIMTVGVLISKIPGVGYFHFLIDGIGYLVHGAGTIPFIDWFGREKNPDEQWTVPLSCITPEGKPDTREEVKNVEVNH